MFREYALEPAVISSFDRLRIFLDSFGPSKGRFLAALPKSWITEVYRQLDCMPVEKKRIEIRLSHLDKRIFSSRQVASYDRTRSWLDNARDEHARDPFYAIIATEAVHDDVIDAEVVDDTDPRWRMAPSAFVDRHPVAILGALQLLLACSTRVLWIDPYFRADTDASRAVFVALCQHVGPAVEVTVHAGLGRDKDPTYDIYRDGLRKHLSKQLGKGRTIRVCTWAARAAGERLHNRYLVTDVGGVQFGDSIVAASQPGEQDRLSILSEEERLHLFRCYQPKSTAFEAVGPEFDVVGSKKSH